MLRLTMVVFVIVLVICAFFVFQKQPSMPSNTSFVVPAAHVSVNPDAWS